MAESQDESCEESQFLAPHSSEVYINHILNHINPSNFAGYVAAKERHGGQHALRGTAAWRDPATALLPAAWCYPLSKAWRRLEKSCQVRSAAFPCSDQVVFQRLSGADQSILPSVELLRVSSCTSRPCATRTPTSDASRTSWPRRASLARCPTSSSLCSLVKRPVSGHVRGLWWATRTSFH